MVADAAPDVAVIVTDPLVVADTLPLPSTLATDPSLLAQVTAAFAMGCPR